MSLILHLLAGLATGAFTGLATGVALGIAAGLLIIDPPEGSARHMLAMFMVFLPIPIGILAGGLAGVVLAILGDVGGQPFVARVAAAVVAAHLLLIVWTLLVHVLMRGEAGATPGDAFRPSGTPRSETPRGGATMDFVHVPGRDPSRSPNPARVPPTTVTRTYLELPSQDALRRGRLPPDDVRLVLREGIGAAEYLALYRRIGAPWHWVDRLAWPAAQLDTHLATPGVKVWVLEAGANVAGYFELQAHGDGRVEILYFGLAPAYMGRGMGGWFLTRAVDEAFAMGAERVVLNTCTLDGPRALPNYLARGFRIVREEEYGITRAQGLEADP